MAIDPKQWQFKNLDELERLEFVWCVAHMHLIIEPDRLLIEPGEQTPENISTQNIAPDNSISKDIDTTLKQEEQQIKQTNISAYPQETETKTSDDFVEENVTEKKASAVSIPDPFPLPNPAEIGKALLPLARRIAGIWKNQIDIDATVEQTAEANGLITLAMKAPLERQYEIHLFIDVSPSMQFWDDLTAGVATLFRWQGFFRDVRVWRLDTSSEKMRLYSDVTRIERDIASLITPRQNRLFLVITDTLGKAWRSGDAYQQLAFLGKTHSVTIAHIFPQYLWSRTSLFRASQRPLTAAKSGCANSQLQRGGRKLRKEDNIYQFPILNLLPEHFVTWAKFLTSEQDKFIQGVILKQTDSHIDRETTVEKPKEHTEPEVLLREFLLDATPPARKLAQILAAVPLIPPVMRLAQKQFLEESEYWHLAEVFFSGLLQRSEFSPEDVSVSETWYEFLPGIRKLLLASSSVMETTEIWREIGSFVEEKYGSPRSFQALMPDPRGSIEDPLSNRDLYFAEVDAAVFMTWGGKYAAKGQELLARVETRKKAITSSEDRAEDKKIDTKKYNFSNFPPLQDLPYEPATIVLLQDIELQTQQFEVAEVVIEQKEYETFEFVTAKLERKPKGLLQRLNPLDRDNEWVINRQTGQARQLIEQLSEEVELEMVLIPPGEFRMGAAPREKYSSSSELPQHKVNIEYSFLMGKYPITQAQWRVVEALPQVNRELKSNPSEFKGDKRPVERINWYEAKEFCQRLSQYTEREYRLPSEAEWEYACRAGTTTPYHFGETITTELANYNGEQTTPVGNSPANVFGLYDMHGNVLEWCEDDWHSDYTGAPTDGSAWLSESGNLKVIRGGSWLIFPWYCRSATRNYNNPENGYDNFGFRVVCRVPRTL
ncbi:MAG: SAV_2336 N-terminal domain-related protein [Xenococcaceae cyanobacterium]